MRRSRIRSSASLLRIHSGCDPESSKTAGQPTSTAAKTIVEDAKMVRITYVPTRQRGKQLSHPRGWSSSPPPPRQSGSAAPACAPHPHRCRDRQDPPLPTSRCRLGGQNRRRHPSASAFALRCSLGSERGQQAPARGSKRFSSIEPTFLYLPSSRRPRHLNRMSRLTCRAGEGRGHGGASEQESRRCRGLASRPAGPTRRALAAVPARNSSYQARPF